MSGLRIAWAIVAHNDSWKYVKWVANPGFDQYRIFRTKRAAFREKRRLDADKTMIWRPWNHIDDPSYDVKVEWRVKKLKIEGVE